MFHKIVLVSLRGTFPSEQPILGFQEETDFLVEDQVHRRDKYATDLPFFKSLRLCGISSWARNLSSEFTNISPSSFRRWYRNA